MNKERRKRIAELIAKLETLDSDLSSLHSDVEEIAEEEREYFDNMPDNMQQGEKGEAADTAANNLSEAKDALETARDEIGTALDKLTETEES